MEDKSDNFAIPVMDTGLERQAPMPEVIDNYVNSLVVFPRGNNYVRDKVIVLKRDASGNSVGSRNDNPIIDTREYRVDLIMGRSGKCRKM